MRAFLVLACLVAAASAASVGYEYEHSGYDYERQNGGSSGVEHGSGQLSQPIQHAAEYSKEFFTYSAPDHEFNDPGHDNQLANSVKKNLRVIFIKGPENSGLENAALQLAKSGTDDRTAIYVLTKQSDVSDLKNKLNTLNQHNANKPEVHFVKYRTPADAENAQRTIQSQYDSLGGSSTSHNGGVAPVLNFASKANHGGSTGGVTSSGSNEYLPPNRRV